MLSKEAILAAQDLKHEDVDCPEWGGKVRIQEMGGIEREEFDLEYARVTKLHGDSGFISLHFVVALCMVDAAGSRMFTTPAEIVALGKKNREALLRCFTKAIQLSGLSKAEQDKIEGN